MINLQYTKYQHFQLRHQPGKGFQFWWRLSDQNEFVYEFPSATVLSAQSTIRLYSGRWETPRSDGIVIATRAIWRNEGETATLTDSAGELVDEYQY